MINLVMRWEVQQRLAKSQFDGFPTVHPLLLQLLHNRNVREAADIETFLMGPSARLDDPFLLRDMDRAVERIARAVQGHELITVYGDFDADGVTSTAVLTETLNALGARVQHYIPQRDEGYGLRDTVLQKLAASGVQLVVTVDCGINSNAEIDAARVAGLDVVITDHHQITGPLPEATAIVNPRREDCGYPFKSLAGVGVAFKVAQALLCKLPLVNGATRESLEESLLDLTALGTITDVVPLVGENRVLACQGLAVLNRTGRPGLRALIESAGLRMGNVTSRDVSHALGPRLNATGRLGDANSSYRLLVATESEAQQLARVLEDANRERQGITEELLCRARVALERRLPEARLLMLSGTDFAPGIVGLVAGRICEEMHRPTVLVAIEGAEARGSCRSISGFDVAGALSECRDLLVRFGGHPRAAGFTVPVENLDELERRLTRIAEEQVSAETLERSMAVDAEINLRGVSWELFQQIQRIGPFGYDNPEPVFMTRELRVIEQRSVGQRTPGHLRLMLNDGKKQWPAIWFGKGELAGEVPERVDALYHIWIDEWNGNRSLRLRLLALREASPD